MEGPMYEWFGRRPEDSWFARHGFQQKSVAFHTGTRHDLLRRHQQTAERAVQAGRQGISEIVPFLLERVADARTLHAAWDDLRAEGGEAPGPNGHRYADFDDPDV